MLSEKLFDKKIKIHTKILTRKFGKGRIEYFFGRKIFITECAPDHMYTMYIRYTIMSNKTFCLYVNKCFNALIKTNL